MEDLAVLTGGQIARLISLISHPFSIMIYINTDYYMHAFSFLGYNWRLRYELYISCPSKAWFVQKVRHINCMKDRNKELHCWLEENQSLHYSTFRVGLLISSPSSLSF